MIVHASLLAREVIPALDGSFSLHGVGATGIGARSYPVRVAFLHYVRIEASSPEKQGLHQLRTRVLINDEDLGPPSELPFVFPAPPDPPTVSLLQSIEIDLPRPGLLRIRPEVDGDALPVITLPATLLSG